MQKVSFQSMMPLINEAFANGRTITIPVTGTSMLPLLRPHEDAVTLSAVDFQSIAVGDILLYRRTNGRYVLHRVVEIYTDSVDFCGDNQVEVEKNVSKSQLIAQVVSCDINGKTIGLDDIRRYGRQRLTSRPARAIATGVHRLRRSGRLAKLLNFNAFSFLFSYLKHRIPVIIAMCFLSSVSALSTLGIALASGRVIDKAREDMQHFAPWFLIMFAMLACTLLCNVIYSSLRVKSTVKLRNDMRRDLFGMLLHKRYLSLQGIHSGEILNHMTSDIQIVVDTAITLIPQIFSMLIKLIGGLLIMLFIEPTFTSLVLIGGFVLALFILLFSRFYKQVHKECQETEGRTRSFLQECSENFVVIKSFVSDKGVLQKLDSYQKDNYKKQVKRNVFSNIGNSGLYAGFTFAYYAGLAWGILRIAGRLGPQSMSFGVFVTFLQIMEQVRAPFRSATGVLPQMISMLASAERLYDLCQLPDEPPIKQFPTSYYDGFTKLNVSGVSFRYDDGRDVFSNAFASLEKGEFTVLVGPSGIGKTTLIKLLLGLVEPDKGHIALEVCEDSFTVDASTRSFFTYVPQGNLLLSGTLRDNILFGTQHVTENELEAVLKLACLDDVIAMLPNGINTFIGERGTGLSEGQSQRVAIARALLSPAPILLLDECTSALDENTEKKLLKNLREMKDRTVLFISHRTAVLECADSIWNIQNGTIHVREIDNKGDYHEKTS